MHGVYSSQSRSRPASVDSAETSLTLLERVKARDGEAWRRLVGLYTPLLHYWCRRWGVRNEDVDDVAQEVFKAVIVGLHRFRREGENDSFRGWLHGVARHKVLTLMRRGGVPAVGGAAFHERTQFMADPAPAEPIDEEEAKLVGGLYQSALRLVRIEFGDRTWQAFWRATVEGQPPAVIADDLGVTPAAVRQAKSRVLRRLKEVLGESPRS